MSNFNIINRQGRGIINTVTILEPERPTHAILCLPGRGQSGQQFVQGFVTHGQLENTLLISFTPNCYAWYPMPRNAMDQDAAVNGVPAAVFSIQEELESIMLEFGIPDENVAIIGFSAGAVMALQYLFESQRNFAAVVAHSGAIFQPERVPVANTLTPVILFHNTNDDCFAWDERFLPMQKALTERKYNTFELIDDGGHSFYVEDMEHVEMFLKSMGFPSQRLTTDDRVIVPSVLTE